MAGVIDAATEQQINAAINALESKNGAEIAVVTVRSTEGRNAKEFATDLFHRWGIGKKGVDNGALILLVVDERRVEVETGYGAEGVLPDGRVGQILDDRVLPRFKAGDYGGGLLAGVQAIASVLEGEPFEAPSSSSGAGRPSVLLIFGLAIGTFVLFYLIKAFMTKPRCRKCRKNLRLLTREQEKEYLTFAQDFEEKIGSMDYQVWRCDDCETIDIRQKVSWLSGYKRCPKCGHRTMRTKIFTVQEPSYVREGVEEIRDTCQFPSCGYDKTRRNVIPRRVRPVVVSSRRGWNSGGGWSSGGWIGGGGWSSGGGGGGWSGGGSFGGGSSGGGGAGRSW